MSFMIIRMVMTIMIISISYISDDNENDGMAAVVMTETIL